MSGDNGNTRTRKCKNCGIDFEIAAQDIKLYEKISPVFNGKTYPIPTPSYCPDCRQQRRLSFRNERRLYKRQCDISGKQIISMYSPDKPYKVYEDKEWWSDKWDPLDYGKDFDSNISFFEQFGELMHEVPFIHLIKFFENENSEYCNYVGELKNCYLEHGGVKNESCYYGYENFSSYNAVDCMNCENSNLVYETILSQNVYNSKYIFFSENIDSCNFVYNCQNLKHCFGCVNLRNQKYCIFNQQYTEEEYFDYLSKIDLGDYNETERFRKEFEQYIKKFPKKNLLMINTENSLGNHLHNCKDCYYCFDMMDIGEGNENTKYCYKSSDIKDSIDIVNSGFNIRKCLDGYNYIANVLNVAFSFHIENSSYIYYSAYLSNCHNCFGCIGLKNAQYCILNKQYTREEYEKLVPEIIQHMKQHQERGDFFPSWLSPFGYNETVAQEYYPLTKEKAEEKGYKRIDKEYPINIPENMEVIQAEDIPEKIGQVDDEILNKAIICEITGRPFRLIKPELRFYRKHNIPIPRKHPDQRHLERNNKRTEWKLYDKNCDNCAKDIKTTYSPDGDEIVYCEECYDQYFYG